MLKNCFICIFIVAASNIIHCQSYYYSVDFPMVRYDTLQIHDTDIDEVLGISFNEIIYLSPQVLKYKHVKSIFIAYSPHANWDSVTTILSKLPNLEALYIYGCSLDSVPIGITRLINLKYINLVGNNLFELTDAFCKLKNLESIVLGNKSDFPTGNNISKLPSCICDLEALKYLYIAANSFKQLPDQIYCLKGLKFLSINFKEKVDDKTINSINRFNEVGKW